jgi:hypothetical protein
MREEHTIGADDIGGHGAGDAGRVRDTARRLVGGRPLDDLGDGHPAQERDSLEVHILLLYFLYKNCIFSGGLASIFSRVELIVTNIFI